MLEMLDCTAEMLGCTGEMLVNIVGKNGNILEKMGCTGVKQENI